MDTPVFTHLCRAGHSEIIEKLAPRGVVLIPDAVNSEIENGRELHQGIPTIASIAWAEIAILSEEETLTALMVKAQLGGLPGMYLPINSGKSLLSWAFEEGLLP